MSMTPHFDLPFRFTDSAAIVDQDTEDDVYNCVLASLLHHYGQRPEAPAFGAGDLTFRQQPIDVTQIIEKIVADEPRAAIFINQNPNLFDSMIANLEVNVGLKETS